MTEVRIKILNEKATIPKYMSEGASGCDAYACLENAILRTPILLRGAFNNSKDFAEILAAKGLN